MTLLSKIEAQLGEALALEFPDLPQEIEVTPATSEKFGHYQCNSPMKLAKLAQKPPREIAAKIAHHLETHMFEKVEVAGPGFINLTLNPKYMSEALTQIVRDPRLGIPLPEKRQKVIVEFSSPNIAKEMHVGHLRSTIIGDSIARLFEFFGEEVVRLNHVGDWGTAFGMLIAYMREEKKESAQATLADLMEWYRASKEKFDQDEAFKECARKAVVELQKGDAKALLEWERICEISREAFSQIYDLLDVHLEERGESFYNPQLPKIVEDLEKKGLITISEGAKCVFHEGFRIPLMVQKSDGGYNYDTTDMAAILHRIRDEKANRIIVVTDAGQRLHFDLIKKTAIQAHYLDPNRVQFDHVTFGVVLGEDGKKFKTRSGAVIRLVDLLQRAIEEARRILKEREGPEEIAEILGIDAVKYADLSCNRISDYVFSYERMLRFDGNTAAFILYSLVRTKGIKRKIGDIDLSKEEIVLEHSAEVDLGLTLLRFHETLEAMKQDLFPHYLTEYLYTLAQKFNNFFRDCRVMGVFEQNRRLLLCECTAKTMELGLFLLGLKTVDRM